ncbi:helix-turn-helix transcriptional regulator [Nocardia otitidiscaviarum]|uniref:helix-turn-helix domain-containing protein n=1 Tax=Nocardia otitidiscaviarum TaxID=1823 RepID=UPI00189387E7|nr:helix-turn-helix transcriptional regulator [Nocardia otitidiscaviarum]
MTEELKNLRGKGTASSPFGESDWERVGVTLRAIRELRGFNPAQLAEDLGISRAYLVNIEAGRKKLTNILLARAAEVLAVPQIAIMRPTVAAIPTSSSARSSRQEVPGAAVVTTPTHERAEVRA